MDKTSWSMKAKKPMREGQGHTAVASSKFGTVKKMGEPVPDTGSRYYAGNKTKGKGRG